MAIDITDLANSIGIKPVGATGAIAKNAVSNAGGKAPKPASFGTNLLHSIESAPGAIVGGLVHGVEGAFSNVAHGIEQGLPGAGSIAQNQKYVNSSIQQLDAAHKSYTQSFASGKISKARYNSLLQDLGKQYDQLSSQSKQNAQTVSPADYASGLATVGSLPFAAGNLVGESGTAKLLGATTAPKSGVVGAALKAPIKAVLNNQVAQTPVQIGQDIANKNYAGAAENAALLGAVPAGIGLASKYLPKVAEGAKTAFFGKSAGPVKAFFGNEAVDKASQNPEVAGLLKQAEGFTMSQPGVKKPAQAAGFFENYLTNTLGLEKGKVTPEEFANRFKPYAVNLQKLQDAKAAGVADARTALTASYKQAVPAALSKVGGDFNAMSPQERVAAVKEAMSGMNIANPRVSDEIGNAAFHANNLNDFKSSLAAIDKYQELKIPGLKPAKGFMFTYGPKAQATLPKAVDAAELASGKGANPVLGKVGAVLTKSGLSPIATDNSKVRGLLTENLDSKLAGTKFDGQAKQVLRSLNEATSNTKGIFDPRLLKISAIEDGLGVSTSEAKTIRKALDSAYSDLPLSVRGLGQKLTDKAIKNLGVGPLSMRNYIKAQGYGRFTGNPVFWAKRDIKSELIAQAESGGKAPNFGRAINRILGTAPSEDTLKTLANEGKFARGGVHAGEADFFGNLFEGTPAASAAKNAAPQYIRQSMGQLAESFAKQRGTTVQAIYENGGEAKNQLDHLLQMVVGYPKDGYLNSNLAKTLNVAVFPSRFETKVATAAATYLAKQPPVTQAAIVKGIMNGKDWLNSDQGKQWKKDNSELIGIAKYFTPLSTVDQVAKVLGGHTQSSGDLGQIGGLPFGVVSQYLGDIGAIPKSPYVDPKTGQVVPSQIPNTDKARMYQGLVDFIGSLYSYPGKTAGLPVSKNDLNKGAVDTATFKTFTPAKNEFTSVGGSSNSAPSSPKIQTRKFSPTTYGQANLGPVNTTITTGTAAKQKAPKKGPTFSPTGLRLRNRAVKPR